MNEYTIGYTACGSIVGLALAAALYMAGGRNNKGIRRFGASFIIMATVVGASLMMGKFSWWLIALYLMKILEFAQGYGVSGNTPKWLKRLIIAATSLMSGVFLCIVFGGGWMLLPLHLWLGLATTQFSVQNPVHAAAEEPLVCILNNLVVIFYVFIV